MEFIKYLQKENVVFKFKAIELSPYPYQPPIPFLDSKKLQTVGIVPVYFEIVVCDMRFKYLSGLSNVFDPGYYYRFPKPFIQPFKP